MSRGKQKMETVFEIAGFNGATCTVFHIMILDGVSSACGKASMS
jgi:hypothetical protein